MLSPECNMSFKCEIKEMPAQPALAIRTRTNMQNLPQTIGESFGKVINYLGQMGEQPACAPYVGYYNMDMNDLDVEMGFPVAKELPGKGEITASQLPGGKMGTCLYTGPYTEMPVAYDALKKLLDEKRSRADRHSLRGLLQQPGRSASGRAADANPVSA